ncbi:MAG: T9SS type A sorting domain-containing protein [Ignavibacteriales bacterium]
MDEYKPVGSYSVKFDGSSLPSGVYLYRLESGGFNASRKFILMK